MGDEVGPRTNAGTFQWWCAGRLSRLLDPVERSVVLGDLVESRTSGARALREIGGLVGRRQAALWLAWRPWLALLLLAVPLGAVLSFVSRWWAQGTVLGVTDYNLERLTWEFLQHPAARRDFIEFIARLLLDNLTLMAWSGTLGFAIGTVSRRTRWVTAGLFCVLLFTAASGTTTTARAFRPDGGVLGMTLIGTAYPLLLRVIAVLLPLEWGMHVSRRHTSPPLVTTLAAALAIGLLTAFEARSVESALTFGAGIFPAPGPDGFVGSLDDGRPWWWVPIVMAMPAMYIAASAVRKHRRQAVPLVVAFALALASPSVLAASQDSPVATARRDRAPAFEVASVKVNRSDDAGSTLHPEQDGGVTVVNMALHELIAFAYQVREFQLEGVPEWVPATRYDVVAKGERDIPATPSADGPPTLLMKLRTLLADRFDLAVHPETRQLPIYELTLARGDRTIGPQLAPSTTDCAALTAAARAAGTPAGPVPGERLQCGLLIGRGRIRAGAVPLAEVTNALGWMLERPVVDRTGLTGLFDLTLTFRPEQLASWGTPDAPTVAADAAPSIFTALQEQLGLKLESTRGPVNAIVIDRVVPATAD